MNIIAYGSLMNKKSLEKTLLRSTVLRKAVLPGYTRVFNAPFGAYAFLNIKPDIGSGIEVGYFALTKDEVSLFRDREDGSVLTEVMPGYFAFIWPENRWKQLPVLQSYMNVCAIGAKDLGVDFSKGLVSPQKIIDDIANPRYV